MSAPTVPSHTRWRFPVLKCMRCIILLYPRRYNFIYYYYYYYTCMRPTIAFQSNEYYSSRSTMMTFRNLLITIRPARERVVPFDVGRGCFLWVTGSAAVRCPDETCPPTSHHLSSSCPPPPLVQLPPAGRTENDSLPLAMHVSPGSKIF